MNMSAIHILERVYNTPIMSTPEKLSVVCGVINSRYGLQPEEITTGIELNAQLLQSAQGKMASVSDAGYVRNEAGVAFVPVQGTLCHRSGGMVRPESGMMSYDGIRNMFQQALADPAVSEIVLDVNSHGGEVHGVFDLANEIYEARGQKPITALINEVGASAAYLLASAADNIIMPESAIAGSIGVVARHMDMSKLNEKEGVKVTYIHAGAKKVLGNPDEPLTDAGRAEIQANVDSTYHRFCLMVSRNRELDVEKVRGTEAGVFHGSEAIAAGLVDSISPAAMVYAFGGGLVDASHNSKQPAVSGKIEGTKPMLKTLLGLMGIKGKDGETDEQASARLDSLNAIFPNDPETVKAEFAAGHGVAEAVQTMRDQHITALNVAADKLKTANDNVAALETKKAELQAVIDNQKTALQDKETRPVVVTGTANADPLADLETQYKADPALAKEFGTFAAFSAYMTAMSGGRARILSAKKPVTE